MNCKIYDEVKQHLFAKDGFIHTCALNDNMLPNGLVPIAYSEKLNFILLEMQKDGYEILDVKLSTSLWGNTTSTYICTMIIYK